MVFWGKAVNVLVLNFSLIICYLTTNLLATTCDFDVKMKHNLLNEGFHRNITYGIVFSINSEHDKWLYKDCTVGLEQTLPRGLYANPDELEDLRRTQRLNAVIKNKVNVEMPAEDSEPNKVYLSRYMIANKVYLWLPVHARYHRAKAGGGLVHNEVSAPKLYLRCLDRRLDACDKHSAPLVTFLCNGSSREKCSWKEIPYTMMTRPIIFDIPVGNTDHYYVVATGTSVAIVTASLYLLRLIHEYKLSETRKKQC